MGQKLEELRQKIYQARSNTKPITTVNSRQNSPSFTIFIELISACVVGLFLGIFLGSLFNAKALCIIICLFLSIAAAFKNLWKTYS